MGLNQTLYAEVIVKHYSDVDKILDVINLSPMKIEGYTSLTVRVPIFSWRKAYQIDSWFGANIFDDFSSSNTAWVQYDSLQELVVLCLDVLANRDDAPELMPTETGLYDDQYFQQVSDTALGLSAILTNEELKDFEFFYEASY